MVNVFVNNMIKIKTVICNLFLKHKIVENQLTFHMTSDTTASIPFVNQSKETVFNLTDELAQNMLFILTRKRHRFTKLGQKSKNLLSCINNLLDMRMML